MTDSTPGTAATDGRDEWAESLSDHTLAFGLGQARERLAAALNATATARGEVTRLEREEARRAK